MPHTRTHAPRGAFIFDTRQLGRQAGSALTQTRTVPAPDDLRLELVYVPVDADVQLDLRFEAVTEGVLVTGTATAPVAGECARCLAPLTSTVTANFMELYLYDDGRRAARSKHDGHDKHDGRDRASRSGPHDARGYGHGWNDAAEFDEPDDDERHLDGDLLDLEPAFRDAVVLALPMSPLCRDDCPGLCATCGAPLAEAGPDHGHDEALDPRWARLAEVGSDDEHDKDEHEEREEHDEDVTDRRASAIDLQEG